MSTRIFVLILLALGTLPLPAEDLVTRDGTVYRNYTVLGHDVGYLTIMYADGGGKIPLSNLPADLQAKYGYDPAKSDQFVKQDTAADRKARADLAQEEGAAAQQQQLAALARQKELASQVNTSPAEAPSPAGVPSQVEATVISEPVSAFAQKFSSSLIVLDNGAPKDLDIHTLAGVKYWAFYYSASWCPPCRAFTPTLVDFYRSFKPSHPQLELIFVNHDQNEDDMLNYMKSDAMPWPAVRFEDVQDPDASRYCGSGIPCLVLVDDSGKVLSDSFQGETYLGPEHVIDDIRSMVK
jgi:nucleoredoxin